MTAGPEGAENQTLVVITNLFNFFAQDLVAGRRRLLHATSKFTARGKTIGANEYINSPVVKQSLGKGFRLCIVGFVITTRTIGARLKLSNEQLELWSNDDNEDPPVTLMNSGVLKKHQFSHSDLDKSKEKLKFSKLNASVCLPTVVEKEIFYDEDRFCPTSGKGSRAHLTLACTPGIKPVTTGFDLILAVKCEQRMRGGENQKAETYTIDGGVLINYGEGIWVVYPNSELLVSSLFSTFL
ncbi:2',3'-cyclic-nucleotide 3'-phosphodiesterase [Portunus trituberculatus]|uniref:2',3'-cyclic-nucleotide 3'-phosphodiesterase n=1 Tax=Portunus trituberculatus TaxID=210409 RepID=A0A5B7DB40_PORTR|nr:2',3'-cyclic-nucleotide 3'-phosphodiesterase [Portunus trituberculatus]